MLMFRDSISLSSVVRKIPSHLLILIRVSCFLTLSLVSPHNSFAITGEESLIDHYYQSILDRAADSGGKSYWLSESQRMSLNGVNAAEAYLAMARYFYASEEFTNRGFSDEQFVSSLYYTFFDRAADQNGLEYWKGVLASGLPRDMVMYAFMFSGEFSNFITQVLGAESMRPEVGAVIDYYRGALGRLPDTDGLGDWVNRFQTAECLPDTELTGGVYQAAIDIAGGFFTSGEYWTGGVTPTQYVSDLYNAFMRRSADLDGFNFWVQQLETGAQTYEQVRQAFIDSQEFSIRVAAIVDAGCPTPTISTTVITSAFSGTHLQNLQISSLSDDGGTASTTDNVDAPEGIESLIFLTDAENNIAGIGISRGDGSAVQIDAASTSVGLVLMAPVGWTDFSATTAELETHIRNAASFSELQTRVAVVLQNNPTLLTDNNAHPEVFESILQVTGEVIDTLSSMIQSLSERPLTTSAIGDDTPSVEVRGDKRVVINPRYIPYGLAAADTNGSLLDPPPYFSPARTFSWSLKKSLIPLQIESANSTEIVYPASLTKLCAAKPDWPILATLGSPIMMGGHDFYNFIDLIQHAETLGGDERLLLTAQLQGMVWWYADFLGNAIKTIPGFGAVVGSLVHDIGTSMINGEMEFWGPVEEEAVEAGVDHLAHKTAGFLGNLGTYYEDESIKWVPKLQRIINKHAANKVGTHVTKKGMRTVFRYAGKFVGEIANVPQVATDLAFLIDTVGAPGYACYQYFDSNFFAFEPDHSSLPNVSIGSIDRYLIDEGETIRIPVRMIRKIDSAMEYVSYRIRTIGEGGGTANELDFTIPIDMDQARLIAFDQSTHLQIIEFPTKIDGVDEAVESFVFEILEDGSAYKTMQPKQAVIYIKDAVQSERGLIAHYPLDGNASDASNNGNDGVLQNSPLSVPDRFGAPGKAMYFDGQSYVQIANATNLVLSSADSFSMTAWIKTQGHPNGSDNMVILSNVPHANSQHLYLMMPHHKSWPDSSIGKISFFGEGSASGNDDSTNSTSENRVDDGQWHFVAGIHDGISGKRKIFVDGALSAEYDTVAQGTYTNNTDWAIGRRTVQAGTSSDVYSYFIGAIDDARIYNRALTDTEVRELAGKTIVTGAGRLNDTGINVCANASSNDLACPISGYPDQDAERGRDVMHNDDSDGYTGFSFTKVCNSGERAGSGSCPADPVLGGGVNDWGCTKDNVTDLLWEVKTDDSGLRDRGWLYTSYDSGYADPNDASSTGGSDGIWAGPVDIGIGSFSDDCGNISLVCGTEQYVADVNGEGLCGYYDWRIPAIGELKSISDYGSLRPSIDAGYFPNTQSAYYWTSTPQARDADRARTFTFERSGGGSILRSDGSFVRLVRSGLK